MTASALESWATRAPDLPPEWTGVTLDIYDAHPSAREATGRATGTRPHLVFGPYGSGPAVAAARATNRVLWNHGGATSRLSRPEFPHVINVLSPASRYFEGVVRVVREADPGAHSVCLLRGTTGFARSVARGTWLTAAELGFEVKETVFQPGCARKAAERVADADILLVVGSGEDELEAASVILFRRWRAAAFVAAGTKEGLASFGNAREGILGPAQWLAGAALAPDEGPDSDWFVRVMKEATEIEPEYPAAQAFAAGVLAARCLRDGGTDDSAQIAAADRLVCRTLYGDFRLDRSSGLQVGHEVLTVQWQSGERRVVWPEARAERPFLYPRR
jgi:branched-chain amino acid transport system substrate-binding protein